MIRFNSIAVLLIAAMMLAIQADASAAPQLCGCKKAKCNSCTRVAPCVDAGCQSCQSATTSCQGCQSCQAKKRCTSCRAMPCRCRRAKRQAEPCCPSCGDCATCLLELDFGKEKKTCFKVEPKQICVPPVRFPWQKCCPPGKAPTKTVKVLTKHTYECESCSYKWTLHEPKTAEPETVVTPAVPHAHHAPVNPDIGTPTVPTVVQPPAADPLPFEK